MHTAFQTTPAASAITAWEAQIERQVATTIAGQVKAGARHIIKHPMVLTGPSYRWKLGRPNLAEAVFRVGAERNLLATGSWVGCRNRLMGAMQAELALRYFRRFPREAR